MASGRSWKWTVTALRDFMTFLWFHSKRVRLSKANDSFCHYWIQHQRLSDHQGLQRFGRQSRSAWSLLEACPPDPSWPFLDHRLQPAEGLCLPKGAVGDLTAASCGLVPCTTFFEQSGFFFLLLLHPEGLCLINSPLNHMYNSLRCLLNDSGYR